MSSLSSRNFLIAALPFLSGDADPDFASLCATSSSFMNGSFVPEFTMKNNLNSETEPIFKLINDFSSTLQFTTGLHLSSPKKLRIGALLRNQMMPKRYFIRQLRSLECFPRLIVDHRIFLEKCLPHLRALRKLSFKMRDLEYKDDNKSNRKTCIAALIPLANLEDLSIDGSESSDLWLSDIWNQNPMPYLQKLKIIGGEQNCYLRSISRFHGSNLEVLDLTLNFPVYSERYCAIFGKSWSVPDLRKMKNLKELYLRGGSILEESVVDELLGFKNIKTRVTKKDDFRKGSYMHYHYFEELNAAANFESYEGNRRFARKLGKRHCYGEAHSPWIRKRNIKMPLNDDDEKDEDLFNQSKIESESSEDEDEDEENQTEDEEDDYEDNSDSDESENSSFGSAVSSNSSSSSSSVSSVVSLSDKVGICKKLRKLHLSGGPFLNSHAGEVYRIIKEIGSTWVTELDLNGLRFNFLKYQEKYDHVVVDSDDDDDDPHHRTHEDSIKLDDRVMAFAIKKFPHLLELNLEKLNHVGDKTVFAIGKHCSSLAKLRLPDLGHVTDKGIAALFDPKKSNNTFRTLEELVVGTRKQGSQFDQSGQINRWSKTPTYYSPYEHFELENSGGVVDDTTNYLGEVYGDDWFGASVVLTEKMSYRLKKLDCSDVPKLNPTGIVRIMNAFSHCLEEFNLPAFDEYKGLGNDDDNPVDIELFEDIVEFPVMRKLKTVTNLPLHVLGFPNIENFIKACPSLQKLMVIYEPDEKDYSFRAEAAAARWKLFEEQKPELKEMRRRFAPPSDDDGENYDDDDNEAWFHDEYEGPSLNQLLVEVACGLDWIDEKRNFRVDDDGLDFGISIMYQKYKNQFPRVNPEVWATFASIMSLKTISVPTEYLHPLWLFAKRRRDVCLCDPDGKPHAETPKPTAEDRKELEERRKQRRKYRKEQRKRKNRMKRKEKLRRAKAKREVTH